MTDVEICNLALSSIGNRSSLIASLSDNSRESQACAQHFEPERDSLLAMAPWQFAIKAATPTATTLTGQKYAFSYSITSVTDWIQMLYVEDNSQVRLLRERINWEQRGQTIYTDQSDATLVYISRVTNTTLFSMPFIDALKYKLAITLAGALGAPAEIAQRLFQTFQFVLQQARAQEFNTAAPEILRNTEMLEARK